MKKYDINYICLIIIEILNIYNIKYDLFSQSYRIRDTILTNINNINMLIETDPISTGSKLCIIKFEFFISEQIEFNNPETLHLELNSFFNTLINNY